jgi:putative addiction module killer protein
VDPFPREVRLFEDSRGRCPFESWLKRLRDIKARAVIRERIARVMLGNIGDFKAVGEGVCELRIRFGPGYRIYFAEDGPAIVVLLCGGDKQSQRSDISKAKAYWDEYKRLTGNA